MIDSADLLPCEDCRAPVGAPCGPTCPSRVSPDLVERWVGDAGDAGDTCFVCNHEPCCCEGDAP